MTVELPDPPEPAEFELPPDDAHATASTRTAASGTPTRTADETFRQDRLRIVIISPQPPTFRPALVVILARLRKRAPPRDTAHGRAGFRRRGGGCHTRGAVPGEPAGISAGRPLFRWQIVSASNNFDHRNRT